MLFGDDTGRHSSVTAAGQSVVRLSTYHAFDPVPSSLQWTPEGGSAESHAHYSAGTPLFRKMIHVQCKF